MSFSSRRDLFYFFLYFSFYTCTKLSVLWSRVLFMALFCKMELIEKRKNYILRFEWLNVRSERAIIPVWCRYFIHKAHFTVLLGPVRCHYLCKWNMYNGKQDNDWQKNVHLSQSSAWICRILFFNKIPLRLFWMLLLFCGFEKIM